jgi:RHS repeat-associated protein
VLYLLGGAFEQIHPVSDSGVTHRRQVQVTDTVVHRRTLAANGSVTTQIEYRHRDHLGNVTVVTNAQGGIASKLAFEPFGARRKDDWTGDLISPAGVLMGLGSTTDRGYTDHEHLDRTGFIHMNGRVFDPRIGRFVQPDPIVQAPLNSQSFNRYAYVFNGPLSLVDPTGFEGRLDQLEFTGGHTRSGFPLSRCSICSSTMQYGGEGMSAFVEGAKIDAMLAGLLEEPAPPPTTPGPVDPQPPVTEPPAPSQSAMGGGGWVEDDMRSPSAGVRRRAARDARRQRGSTEFPELAPGPYPFVVDALTLAYGGAITLGDLWIVDPAGQQILHFGVIGLGPAAMLGGVASREVGVIYLVTGHEVSGIGLSIRIEGVVGVGGASGVAIPLFPLAPTSTSISGGMGAGLGAGIGVIGTYAWFKKVYSFDVAPPLAPTMR